MFSLFNSKLSIKEQKLLKLHSYKAIDKSILSTYFYKKYTSLVLFYTPEWMSPNLLTLFGFIAMLMNFLIVIFCDLELREVKEWLAFLNAMALSFYFTMDNLDGAQARKHKEMSPLGQLFDHGVDSCVVFFCMITLISSLKLGLTNTAILTLLTVMFGFYFSGLEEKFTGVFEFGFISGPTEGITFMIILHLMASYCSNTVKYAVDQFTFYPPLTKIITFLPISPLFVIALCVFVYNFVTSFTKSYNSYLKKSEEVLLSYLSLTCLLIPFYYFNLSLPLRPDLKIINLMIFAQIFSLKYIEEIFCNMIGRVPKYFNIIYILYFVSFIVFFTIDFFKVSFLLVGLFLISTVYYLNSIYNLIISCKSALKINVILRNNKKIN